MEWAVKRFAFGLLLAALVVACGDSDDTRTHRGYVEYRCQAAQERLEGEGRHLKPELRPEVEQRVETLCDDLRRSRNREEAVEIWREADLNSWYRIENMEYPDEPWSGE